MIINIMVDHCYNDNKDVDGDDWNHNEDDDDVEDGIEGDIGARLVPIQLANFSHLAPNQYLLMMIVHHDIDDDYDYAYTYLVINHHDWQPFLTLHQSNIWWWWWWLYIMIMIMQDDDD